VIHPANTGRDNNNNIVVKNKDHIKRGSLSHFKSFTVCFIIVERKFMEPPMDEAPARCKLNIAISTDGPE